MKRRLILALFPGLKLNKNSLAKNSPTNFENEIVVILKNENVGGHFFSYLQCISMMRD